MLRKSKQNHGCGLDLYDHVIKFDQCFYMHCPQPYVWTMYVKARVKLDNKIIQILRGNFKSSQRFPTYQQNTPATTLLNNNLPAPKHITFTHISQNFTHNPEHTTSAIFCARKKTHFPKPHKSSCPFSIPRPHKTHRGNLGETNKIKTPSLPTSQ